MTFSKTYAAAVTGLALIAAPAAMAQAATDATFIKLQHDWAEARKSADIAFLDHFYAAEFTVGDMSGREASRAEDIARFASGDLKPAVITDDQIKVDLLGTAALVTGVEHLEGTYKGHAGQFDLRFANTYVLRDGRWQLVRHQATQIPAPIPPK